MRIGIDHSIIKRANGHIKQLLIALLFVISSVPCQSQTLFGTTGMMNAPSADMRPTGTFDGGFSLVQKNLLYNKNYNTLLYYISFTPFSWMEITYREIMLKRKSADDPDKMVFYNEDRSTSIRVRPLKEGKYWPAVVLGVNDLVGNGSSRTASVYGVVSKHFPIAAVGTFEATVGYAIPYEKKKGKGTVYDGVLGGLTFAPAFFPDMRVMCEYDTQGCNVGIGAFLFRHLNLTCFTREFKGINATVSYQYTIPY